MLRFEPGCLHTAHGTVSGYSSSQCGQCVSVELIFFVRLVNVSAEADVDVAAALDVGQVQEAFRNGQGLVLHADRLVAKKLA